jgi:hypothetical protein
MDTLNIAEDTHRLQTVKQINAKSSTLKLQKCTPTGIGFATSTTAQALPEG